MKRTPMPPRRTPLARGDSTLERTPLARGESELRRHVEMKRVNAKRRAEAFVEDFGSVARVRFVQMQECAVASCRAWPSECAHATSGGAGGGAADILPLCRWHHSEQHRNGVRTFEERHGINLAECAAETDARWRAYLERSK